MGEVRLVGEGIEHEQVRARRREQRGARGGRELLHVAEIHHAPPGGSPDIEAQALVLPTVQHLG